MHSAIVQTHALTRTSSRVTGLDAARVLATLGIVWVHVAEIQNQSPELSTLGRFGTSFYTIAALFLSCRSHFLGRQVSARAIVARRARRLLVPYVIWCALYAIFYFSTMYSQGHPVEVIVRYWGPLYGTAPHLWFLPFAFTAGALSSYCVPQLMKWPSWLLWTIGGISTLGLYIYVYGWGYAALDQVAITSARVHRLARWVEEVPLVCGAIFGLSLYGKHYKKLGKMGRRARYRLAYGACLVFIVTQCCYAFYLEDLATLFWNRVRFFANVAGAAWLVIFVSARDGVWIRKLAPLGRATYFAYLSHQMILDCVKLKLSTLPGHGTLLFAIASTLLIFGCAVGLGLWVARVRLLRWLSP